MTEPWQLPVEKVTSKQAMQNAQNETIAQMQHLGDLCNRPDVHSIPASQSAAGA